MSRFLIFAVVMCLSVIGQAHAPNEAFFNIRTNGNELHIEAELPWSIRNALLKYDAALEQAETKEAYDHALKNYFNEKIHLYKSNGDLIVLKELKDVPSHGHSHQVNYILIYDGIDWAKIENEVLFELYEHQENYHTIFEASGSKLFTTNQHQNTYVKDKSILSKGWLLNGFIAFSVLLLAFILIRKRRRSGV